MNEDKSREQLNEQELPTERPVVRVKRHRRIRYAAPLGFFVLLFAVIGVISVMTNTVRWFIRMGDDTPLRNELYTFLDPVMQFCPSEFTSVEESQDPDLLLIAAVYRVSEQERIRQLREKDEQCTYPIEEKQYRMIVPQTTIEKSYQHLFGTAALTHRTVGDIEYNTENSCYYVPMAMNTSGYTPILGRITHKKDTYTVQVAYVANADIQVDERGNNIEPTIDMAKYSQRYTIKKTDGGWQLVAVAAW